MHRSTLTAALAALTVVALPGSAAAHVTLQPDEVPAGAFKRLDVRVPNERDDASTKRVEVKFPPGFIFVSHEAVPGWRAEVRYAKLEKPIELYGEKRTEEVDTVTFTTKGDGIAAGEFQDFGLSVGLPDTPGRTLEFKALQTYSDGEVVRWIGAEEADKPAARVKLLAASEAAPTVAENAESTAQLQPAVAASGDGGGGADGGGSDTVSVIALIVGGLGLLAGLAGLAAARSARPTAAA